MGMDRQQNEPKVLSGRKMNIDSNDGDRFDPALLSVIGKGG